MTCQFNRWPVRSGRARARALRLTAGAGAAVDGVLNAHEVARLRDGGRVDHLALVHEHALPASHVLLERREHLARPLHRRRTRRELLVHHWDLARVDHLRIEHIDSE